MNNITVKADKHSNHNLPIGAVVERCAAPEWDTSGVEWYTQGGVGDEVAIDPRDLEVISDD